MLFTALIFSISGADSVAWVRFVDKGLAREEAATALVTRIEELDPRARARRERARFGDTADVRDLPVFGEYVDAVRSMCVKERFRSRWLNAVSVEANEASLERIRAMPFVESVVPVARRLARHEWFDQRESEPRELHFSLDEPLAALMVPPLHACSLSGAGVRVAVLDSGFNLEHILFTGLDVTAQWDFVGQDADVSIEQGEQLEEFIHGTQTLSIVAGLGGEYHGVAPHAELLLARVEESSSESPADEDRFVAGLEWAEAQGAQIVSASLGYKDWYEYEDLDGNSALSTLAAQVAADNGVLVVTAIGNAGPEAKTLSAPADAVGVLAVGAVDPELALAEFSSRGPTSDGRIKPDVLAPGMKIWTADAGDVTSYLQMVGTSASTPFIAGIAALLLEASPETVPSTLAETLRSTAVSHNMPDQDAGWGLVNAHAAHARVVYPRGTVCDRTVASGSGSKSPTTEGCGCQTTEASIESLMCALALLPIWRRRRLRREPTHVDGVEKGHRSHKGSV